VCHTTGVTVSRPFINSVGIRRGACCQSCNCQHLDRRMHAVYTLAHSAVMALIQPGFRSPRSDHAAQHLHVTSDSKLSRQLLVAACKLSTQHFNLMFCHACAVERHHKLVAGAGRAVSASQAECQLWRPWPQHHRACKHRMPQRPAVQRHHKLNAHW
jgi:hypothetical protein